jgi:two-component system, OmpR family, phosphate regulon sensor histidine kinase PhoR
VNRPVGWRRVAGGFAAIALIVAAFSLGWLLAESLFLFTGRPPAFAGYFVAVFFGLGSAGLSSAIFSKLRGRRLGEGIFDDLRDVLERVSQGDFDVQLKSDGLGPYGEVVETVNRMARELGSLEQQRQDFVSNVSHEIQSPLTSISGFAGLLRDPALDDATRQHYLDIISAECERLSGLSDKLLRLAALDDTTLSRSSFRLDDQLRDVILMLEPHWSGKGVSVELDAVPALVDADLELLRQVWVNLIQNAVKFTPSGGHVQVQVAADPSGGYTVEVTDTGSGIAASDQPHVFERFYRADKARSAGGQGLGLALAKRIADLHEGRIVVSSTPGSGATFTTHLP